MGLQRHQPLRWFPTWRCWGQCWPVRKATVKRACLLQPFVSAKPAVSHESDSSGILYRELCERHSCGTAFDPRQESKYNGPPPLPGLLQLSCSLSAGQLLLLASRKGCEDVILAPQRMLWMPVCMIYACLGDSFALLNGFPRAALTPKLLRTTTWRWIWTKLIVSEKVLVMYLHMSSPSRVVAWWLLLWISRDFEPGCRPLMFAHTAELMWFLAVCMFSEIATLLLMSVCYRLRNAPWLSAWGGTYMVL